MTYDNIEATASEGAHVADAARRDLFEDAEAATKSVAQVHLEQEPHERAMKAIERVLIAGYVLLCAWSSGKDSSCVANLMFNAAMNIIRAGHKCPTLIISHSDTGVESPVVRALADGELHKMRQFADKHGLPLEIRVGKPTLGASFATRIIGGRALPSFPQANRDCSINWKVQVSQRIINGASKSLATDALPIVTLIGTRSEESATRKVATAARRETAHELWYSVTGDARLSPILDWDSSDVWTYLAECSHGVHPTYSDFQATIEFYADSGGSSCVVVADMQAAGKSKACGARSGCWSCVATSSDHSVETMIAHNPERYPYLVPLLELRNFIALCSQALSCTK